MYPTHALAEHCAEKVTSPRKGTTRVAISCSCVHGRAIDNRTHAPLANRIITNLHGDSTPYTKLLCRRLSWEPYINMTSLYFPSAVINFSASIARDVHCLAERIGFWCSDRAWSCDSVMSRDPIIRVSRSLASAPKTVVVT